MLSINAPSPREPWGLSSIKKTKTAGDKSIPRKLVLAIWSGQVYKDRQKARQDWEILGLENHVPLTNGFVATVFMHRKNQ
jgi:hypothetical protein